VCIVAPYGMECCLNKGCPFGCVGRVEKTTRERMPRESNSETSMLCTLVPSLTSPLPSQRQLLALCRQKLKFTEEIVTASSRAVAICTQVPLPAPVYLTPVGGQCGGFAVPLCCRFPGSDSEAEGEEKVCSALRESWLEERGIAPASQAIAPNGWAGLPKDAFHLPSSAFSIFPVNGL